MKFQDIINWKNIYRVIVIGGFIVAAIGLKIAIDQLWDIKKNQSAQFMLEFDKNLTSGKNLSLLEAIENGQPIFLPNGKFSSTDVDIFLSQYELLNSTYQAGLLDNDMLYNTFSYDLQKTFQNPEIKEYLEKVRKEDPRIFMGFEELAESVQNAN